MGFRLRIVIAEPRREGRGLLAGRAALWRVEARSDRSFGLSGLSGRGQMLVLVPRWW